MNWYDALPAELPAGRLVPPVDDDYEPVYWLGDAPATPGWWATWHARHPRTGLWPLLVEDDTDVGDPLEVDPDDRDHVTSPDHHDGAAVLVEWWREWLGGANDVGGLSAGLTPAGRAAAAGGASPTAVARAADAYAEALLAETRPRRRLRPALVPATDGPDALTTLGWAAPNHYVDSARYTAVLRHWRSTHGTQLVGLGASTLYLSVAAPPTDDGQSLSLAAGHVAFCPDIVDGSTVDELLGVAEEIRGATEWAFWWD